MIKNEIITDKIPDDAVLIIDSGYTKPSEPVYEIANKLLIEKDFYVVYIYNRQHARNQCEWKCASDNPVAFAIKKVYGVNKIAFAYTVSPDKDVIIYRDVVNIAKLSKKDFISVLESPLRSPEWIFHKFVDIYSKNYDYSDWFNLFYEWDKCFNSAFNIFIFDVILIRIKDHGCHNEIEVKGEKYCRMKIYDLATGCKCFRFVAEVDIERR